MLTDPSYISYWDDDAEYGDAVEEGHFSYPGACNRTLAGDANGQLNFPAGHAGAGVVVRSGYGDGYYPVYATTAETEAWGKRVVKVEIYFDDEPTEAEDDGTARLNLTPLQVDTLRGYLGEILATDSNDALAEIYERLTEVM
jgi:hypothetical protein